MRDKRPVCWLVNVFFGGNGGDPRFVEWRRGGASFKGIVSVNFKLFDSRAFQSAQNGPKQRFEKRGSRKVRISQVEFL
jgi:hypothetical protein